MHLTRTYGVWSLELAGLLWSDRGNFSIHPIGVRTRAICDGPLFRLVWFSFTQSVSQSVTRLHVLRTGKLGTDKKMGEDLHSNVKYLVCFCLFSVVCSYFLFRAVRCMFAWLFIRGKVFCVYVMTAH